MVCTGMYMYVYVSVCVCVCERESVCAVCHTTILTNMQYGTKLFTTTLGVLLSMARGRIHYHKPKIILLVL